MQLLIGRKGNCVRVGRVVTLTIFNLNGCMQKQKTLVFNKSFWVTNGARTRDPQNHNLML